MCSDKDLCKAAEEEGIELIDPEEKDALKNWMRSPLKLQNENYRTLRYEKEYSSRILQRDVCYNKRLSEMLITYVLA